MEGCFRLKWLIFLWIAVNIASLFVWLAFTQYKYDVVLYEPDPCTDKPNLQKELVQSLKEDVVLPNLPPEVVAGIQSFVLFVGYPRSGHSIIGSFLDAHPNVVIAHEYNTFNKLQRMTANGYKTRQNYIKNRLLNDIYHNSYINAFLNGTRNRNNKGYNLTVDNTWQGRYKDRILVIGDKRAGGTTYLYVDNSTEFRRIYKILTEILPIPVRVFHCVRNPFDIISTQVLYEAKLTDNQPGLVQKVRTDLLTGEGVRAKFKNHTQLLDTIKTVFNLADSVYNMSRFIFPHEAILDIHHHELISSPRTTILKLCNFLRIDCPADYVGSCAEKVFPELSRTRFAVDWPKELIHEVEQRISNYPFFRGYSYNSSI